MPQKVVEPDHAGIWNKTGKYQCDRLILTTCKLLIYFTV